MEHEEEKRRSLEDGSNEVIGAFIEVHRHLKRGPESWNVGRTRVSVCLLVRGLNSLS
jgi:hypothetical protein